jgi:rubrerythrin
MTIENKLLKQARGIIKQDIPITDKQKKIVVLFKNYSVEINDFLAVIDKHTCLCLKCGYLWLGRTEQPKECPNCKKRIIKI